MVLQAPVSDREWLASLPATEGQIAVARARLGGNELMPIDTDVAPMTASRFLSFATKVLHVTVETAALTGAVAVVVTVAKYARRPCS